jgi:hypothetical protein
MPMSGLGVLRSIAMKTNVTLEIDAELLRELNVVAANEGRSISALLAEKASSFSGRRPSHGSRCMSVMFLVV